MSESAEMAILRQMMQAAPPQARRAPSVSSRGIKRFLRPVDAASKTASCAALASGSVDEVVDEDIEDCVDIEDATADFTTRPNVPRLPATIHSDLTDVDLHTGALWSVDTRRLPAAAVDAHVAALLCTPNKDKESAYGKPVSFAIGSVTADGRLHMPPVYAMAAFPAATPTCSTLTAGEPMREEAQFTGKLWQTYPPQQAAVDAFAAWMAAPDRTCHAAMISLPCGHGKSVVSLAITTTVIRRVTLILMHMCGLVGQWIDEVRLYVPGARVGYITADAVRIEGADIIVASIHSLRSHINNNAPYLASLYARVGFVILDEAHHGVANTFQFVMAHLPAKWRMAVTATPRRSDGLFNELQWIFGPIVFQSFRR